MSNFQICILRNERTIYQLSEPILLMKAPLEWWRPIRWSIETRWWKSSRWWAVKPVREVRSWSWRATRSAGSENVEQGLHNSRIIWRNWRPGLECWIWRSLELRIRWRRSWESRWGWGVRSRNSSLLLNDLGNRRRRHFPD